MTLSTGRRLGPYEIVALLYLSLGWLKIDPNFDPSGGALLETPC